MLEQPLKNRKTVTSKYFINTTPWLKLNDALEGLLFAPKVPTSQTSTAHGAHLVSLDYGYTLSPFPLQGVFLNLQISTFDASSE